MLWERRLKDEAQFAYLESFVLKDSLDGGILSTGRQLCLEDYTEGTVAHYLALCILHFSCLAREAILHLLSYHL